MRAVLDDAARVAALHRLGVLDTLPEPVFDTVAASAAQACGVPIALVSLVDAQRQWFKSNVGLPGTTETPRDVAFCDHAIRDDALFEVPDATLDARFADNPLVTGDPDIRFYAGAPIVLADGARIGTVCVIDRHARRLDDAQRAMLCSLATIVSSMLEQRRKLLDATVCLAENEQRARRLYEASPAILHSLGADGRIVSVSDRWLALFGYERHEVVGRPSSDFLSEASRVHARDVVLPAFLRTGRCDHVDYQFVRRDGSLVDVLLSATLERDAAGAPARSFAVLEDVTAHKRVAAELWRTHAHLDAVVDNMPALVGYWDRDAVTRFANRDFQAAVGLPNDRLIGCSLPDIFESVDPSGWAAVAPHVAAVLAGRRQEFECAMLTTSGLRQLRVTLVPAQPDGRIDGFYGTWFDITGMKSLEMRQRDSELRYRLLFDHLNSAYALHAIEFDAEGQAVDYRYLAMNPAYSAMVGLDPATTIGARATTVFPRIKSDPADWIGKFAHVVSTGVPMRIEQLSAVSGRWWDIVAYRSAPGQFAVIAQDISERKRLEADLAERERCVVELERRAAARSAGE